MCWLPLLLPGVELPFAPTIATIQPDASQLHFRWACLTADLGYDSPCRFLVAPRKITTNTLAETWNGIAVFLEKRDQISWTLISQC